MIKIIKEKSKILKKEKEKTFKKKTYNSTSTISY